MGKEEIQPRPPFRPHNLPEDQSRLWVAGWVGGSDCLLSLWSEHIAQGNSAEMGPPAAKPPPRPPAPQRSYSPASGPGPGGSRSALPLLSWVPRLAQPALPCPPPGSPLSLSLSQLCSASLPLWVADPRRPSSRASSNQATCLAKPHGQGAWGPRA